MSDDGGHDGRISGTYDPGCPRGDARAADGAGGSGCTGVLLHVQSRAAADIGLTTEDVQGLVIAIAPIGGAPKILGAAGTIAAARGLAVVIDDAITEAAADG